MKNSILFILFIFPLVSISQIPDGYYDTVEGKTGEELKTALYNIIKGHTAYSYDKRVGTDVTDIPIESDKNPNNPNNVILLYTGRSQDVENRDQGDDWDYSQYASGNGTLGNSWNKEHVWSTSRGNFGDNNIGPKSDVHNLRPADRTVNTAKSNRFFAPGDTEYYDDGIPTGCYKSSIPGNYIWEPRDAVKGDVARIIFYMATRYEGENGEPDLELTDEIKPQSDDTPFYGKQCVLLKWNNNDPPDDFERNRNEVIYSYQGIRNPFIDHPEYASIFRNPICDTNGNALRTDQHFDLKINQIDNTICVKFKSKDSGKISVDIFNVLGKKIDKELFTSSPGDNLFFIDISELTTGIYIFKFKVSEDRFGVEKIAIK